MLVKNNMVDFFFSKIIAKHKDSQASEGPHHSNGNMIVKFEITSDYTTS